MEWLIENANALWAEIMATGALGVIALKTFVLDKIGNKRVEKRFLNLNSIQNKIEGKVEKANEIVYEKLHSFENVVKEFTEKLANQEKENTALTSLVIQILSTVNMPLEQRQATFEALTKLSNINEQVINAFKKSLDVQKKQVKTEIEHNQKITNDLKSL